MEEATSPNVGCLQGQVVKISWNCYENFRHPCCMDCSWLIDSLACSTGSCGFSRYLEDCFQYDSYRLLGLQWNCFCLIHFACISTGLPDSVSQGPELRWNRSFKCWSHDKPQYPCHSLSFHAQSSRYRTSFFTSQSWSMQRYLYSSLPYLEVSSIRAPGLHESDYPLSLLPLWQIPDQQLSTSSSTTHALKSASTAQQMLTL